MPLRFAITFDYLCPFARNANEHVIAGLRDGADWDVTFTPFSLMQSHVDPGDADVWDRDEPDRVSGLLALQASVAVRDKWPDHFLDVHEGLFAARHDHGLDIKNPEVVGEALEAAGLDAGEVFDVVSTGVPLATVRTEHTIAATERHVWGVPTFVTDTRAVFVRVMDRPDGDGTLARQRVEQIVELVDGTVALHEFKQADLPM